MGWGMWAKPTTLTPTHPKSVSVSVSVKKKKFIKKIFEKKNFQKKIFKKKIFVLKGVQIDPYRVRIYIYIYMEGPPPTQRFVYGVWVWRKKNL